MTEEVRKKVRIYATNVLGVLCILLAPIVSPFPGPGGTPLLLGGLSLLAINNVWAKRLKKFAEENISNLTELIFLENKKCRWAWDIFVYLSLSAGIYLLVKSDFHYVIQTLITTILGFIVVAWFRNHHRWQRLLKYFNLIPTGDKTKEQPATMKAITLHQPWAALVACGAKNTETRSWHPPKNLLGQRLAIHAGKKSVKIPAGAFAQAVDSCLGKGWRSKEAFGAVIATAKLKKVKKITGKEDISKKEILFGDYAPGRWMWQLADIKKVEPPVITRGYQKIWNLKEKI